MAPAPLAATARSYYSRAYAYATAHKVITGVAIVIVLFAGYKAYGAFAGGSTTTTYVTAEAATSTIVATVSGSGQVAATTQVSLKPQASGQIVYVGVKQGQQVSKGTELVGIDATSAEKSVRDAKANLTAAQISYQQSITSSSNSVTSERDNGFDTATAAFADLTSVTQGLNTIEFGTTDGYGGEANVNAYADIVARYAPSAQLLAQTAVASYRAAIDSYNQSFALYQNASRTSDPADIIALLQATNDTATKVNQATKDAVALFNLTQTTLTTHNDLKTPSNLASQTSSLVSYGSKISADNSSVLSALTALQNATASLDNDPSGVPLDVQSAELNLTKAQNALQDAEDTLSNYSITAPFDGTVAALTATVGADSGTLVVTMVTPQESAVLSLDEVDAASVKLGQKATLTFDAVSDLTLTGTVTGVDTLGTVSQGVVTYDVTITFDSQDARVKPGMTVSAAIITQTAVDALTVPSSAVKTVGGNSVVQVFNPPLTASSSDTTGAASSVPPKSVVVTTGISDDTDTQILSGLTAGEQVVVRTSTTAATSAKATPAAASAGARSAGNATFRGL